jgi:hypothetical protein
MNNEKAVDESCQLPGGTEGNHKNVFRQDNQSAGQDLKLGPGENKRSVLISRLRLYRRKWKNTRQREEDKGIKVIKERRKGVKR